MIRTILDLVYDYMSLKKEGKDTLECRRNFAKALMAFIDFRVGADEKELKTDVIDLLSNAPIPGSENFDEEYKEWYEKTKEIF